MRQALRPQLTVKIVLYALVDVMGMLIFSSGAMWLARSQTLFIPNFPTNMLEAIATTLAGFLLMIWAVTQILRELLNRRSDNA